MDVRVPRVPRDPEIRRLRARVAQAARYHPEQPELADDDRRALKAAVAEQYVRDLVDRWPPLTPSSAAASRPCSPTARGSTAVPHSRGAPAVTPEPQRPATAKQKVDATLPECGDGRADPREIGALFAAWLDVKMGQIDDLVAEAQDKADSIPSWRDLAPLFGEYAIRVHLLEQQIDALKKELAALRRGRR